MKRLPLKAAFIAKKMEKATLNASQLSIMQSAYVLIKQYVLHLFLVVLWNIDYHKEFIRRLLSLEFQLLFLLAGFLLAGFLLDWL